MFSKRVKRIKSIILICVLISLCVPAEAAQANIAVAANFTDATRSLVAVFQEQSGHQVKVSYGSTGKLYAQISNGAPFDVFLSADSARPILAEKNRLAVRGSRFTYAQGSLVLWSPDPTVFSQGENYLKHGKFKRLAIANPKTAPYGVAALAVMKRLNLHTSSQNKLVRGDSIAQTFQFVATENAQAGFVALSQVKAWNKTFGSVWYVPSHYYPPIAQQAVLLERGKNNLAAKAFLDFLRSKTAISTIKQLGYGIE